MGTEIPRGGRGGEMTFVGFHLFIYFIILASMQMLTQIGFS